MKNVLLAKDALPTNPYPSVSAWVNGNSQLVRLEAGHGPSLSLANYVDVHFMGDHFMGDHLKREVFTAAPNESQRAHYYSWMPVFTTDALKATLETDDPNHFKVLATSLTSSQWDQLTLAANLSESYGWRGAIYLKTRSFNSLIGSEDESFRAWVEEMFYRFENFNPADVRLFPRNFCGNRKFRLELNCRDFIVYLHNCDAIADVLTPLCDLEDKCREILSVSRFEMLGEFYESIRPGADLYRSIPESVIKSFIEIGGAQHLVNAKHKKALYRLASGLSDVGFELDDNTAFRDNDKDKKVEKWWKWTDGNFDYCAHYGFGLMSSMNFLERYAEHISGACIAFDPSIRTNLEVLERLDKGKPTLGFVDGPIIKDIKSVHADLLFIKSLLVDALHHCRTTIGELVLPPRLQKACKPMPKLSSIVESPIGDLSDTAEDICEKINTILGVALNEGKRIIVTGEEEIGQHFHSAKARQDGIFISYGPRRSKTIKDGAYGAEISKRAGRSLLRKLDAKATHFQCRDSDEEPLKIQIL